MTGWRTNLCLATLAILCTLVIEGTFRLVGYDWERRLRDNVPIFYRQPTEPIGDIFFRRPGPAGVIESRVPSPRRLLRDAYFASDHGDVPVSLIYTPPGSAKLTSEQSALLGSTVRSMAESGRRHRIEPWLVYMPCKFRVLHGHLRFTEDAEARLRQWQPSDLPAVMARMAAASSVGFIDVTPALEAESARGVLTYNSVADTHLNRHGSAVVAHAIAAALPRSR